VKALSEAKGFLPLVTIAVCTRNNEKTITRTLKSILNLEYLEKLLEIVIVDGLSEDNTLNITKDLLGQSGLRWKILSDQGRGLGYARQLTVENSSGDFIAFVDADQSLHPTWLKEALNELLSCPDIVAVRGAQGLTLGLPVQAALENYLKFVEDRETDREADVKYFAIGGSLFRKTPIVGVGGFNSLFTVAAEDTDLAVRLAKAGWRILNSKTAIFYHHPRTSWRALYVQYRNWGKNLLPQFRLHFFEFSISSIFLFFLCVRYIFKTFKVTRDIRCILIPFHYMYKRAALAIGILI
jgi:glycosyltransferase involved in cell wall biosynthesis